MAAAGATFITITGAFAGFAFLWLLAEAQDQVDAEAHGDVPNVPREMAATRETARGGESCQGVQRPTQKDIIARHRNGTVTR